VTSKKAVDDYFRVFDTYFTAEKADAFRKSAASGRWHKLGVPGIDAQVGFSPHTVEKGLLEPLERFTF
jgi:hypothetical protein